VKARRSHAVTVRTETVTTLGGTWRHGVLTDPSRCVLLSDSRATNLALVESESSAEPDRRVRPCTNSPQIFEIHVHPG